MKMKPEKMDMRPYYTLGLPLLGLMGLVVLAGVTLEVVMRVFF